MGDMTGLGVVSLKNPRTGFSPKYDKLHDQWLTRKIHA